MRPYLKKTPSQQRAGGVAQGVGPEFKPQSEKNSNTMQIKWHSQSGVEDSAPLSQKVHSQNTLRRQRLDWGM
jgi:hypothetical protein